MKLEAVMLIFSWHLYFCQQKKKQRMTKVADFICPPWCFAQNSQFAQTWIKRKNISLENWKMQFVQRFIGRRKKERWRVRCLVSDTKVVKQNRVNEHRGRLNAIALFALVFPLSTTTSSSSFNWSSPIEDWSLIRELHHHHHYHYHQHDHQCSIWSISVNTRLHWRCPDKQTSSAQLPSLTKPDWSMRLSQSISRRIDNANADANATLCLCLHCTSIECRLVWTTTIAGSVWLRKSADAHSATNRSVLSHWERHNLLTTLLFTIHYSLNSTANGTLNFLRFFQTGQHLCVTG